MIRAPSIIKESFSAYARHPRRHIGMSVVYLFSSLLIKGAILGIWLLVFVFLLLLNLVEGVGIFILAPVGFVLSIFAVYFLFSFTGGFFEGCHNILTRKENPVTYFLKYSMRRGLTFFGVGIAFLAPILAVGIPLAVVNLYVDNTIVLTASILLVVFVSFIVSLLFSLLLPATVIDNIGARQAVVRSVKTVLFNLADFIILILFMGFFSAILLIVPIVGWIAAPLFGLPVMCNALLLFYKNLRRV